MALNLPTYTQERLGESPLAEVVCQLRFNPILKIRTNAPAEFQDRVREHFPVFAEERGIEFAVVGSQPMAAKSTEPAWQFKTADDAWVASLTSNFLALKTVAYEDIEDFLRRLAPLLQAFEDLYQPSDYTRVGIRYVNRLILPRPQGESRVAWEKLLNGHLAGAFADDVLSDAVMEANHHLVLRTDDGQIGWRYSRDVGVLDDLPAERYTLDFDHFRNGPVNCEDVEGLLSKFNDSIYRLFRWCFTPDGYSLLKPRPKSKGTSKP